MERAANSRADIAKENEMPKQEQELPLKDEQAEAAAKAEKADKADFKLHVAMIQRATGATATQAKFIAWQEGREGLEKRLGVQPKEGA